jgi:hypothetical protein
VADHFPGFGQQAYIGFERPLDTNDITNVWRPINLAPIPTGQTLITFTALMQIVDSTNEQYDDFRWSVYNTNEARLFTLDFEGSSLAVSYALDDGLGFVPTGLQYAPGEIYDLKIVMNFARNLWSASLNGLVVVNAKPITSACAALNLGDIDAVWAIRRPASPGDNFMVFDEYIITADDLPSIPPTLEFLPPDTAIQRTIRVYGEPGLRYAIEASPDLQHWEPIQVISAPADGIFDVPDGNTGAMSNRFFRAWQVP